ncbi:MAG: hypothetical protein ACI35O_16565 [Bacillaceae bacterium]
MKNLIPLMISEIKKSFFYKQQPSNDFEPVINYINSLSEDTLYNAMKKISDKANKTEELNQENLYYLAWRTVQSHYKYPFKENDIVIYNRKERKIVKIDETNSMAEMENGDLIHLFVLSLCNPEYTSKQSFTRNNEPEQLVFF